MCGFHAVPENEQFWKKSATNIWKIAHIQAPVVRCTMGKATTIHSKRLNNTSVAGALYVGYFMWPFCAISICLLCLVWVWGRFCNAHTQRQTIVHTDCNINFQLWARALTLFGWKKVTKKVKEKRERRSFCMLYKFSYFFPRCFLFYSSVERFVVARCWMCMKIVWRKGRKESACKRIQNER